MECGFDIEAFVRAYRNAMKTGAKVAYLRPRFVLGGRRSVIDEAFPMNVHLHVNVNVPDRQASLVISRAAAL